MATKKPTPKEKRYEISDELVAEAMLASGKKTPQAVMKVALEELISSRAKKKAPAKTKK
jgi:Arc/MetJ family transcription regulator